MRSLFVRALALLVGLFVATVAEGRAQAQCEKVEERCICSCPAGTVQQACKCVAKTPTTTPQTCTRQCPAHLHLDRTTCRCIKLGKPACNLDCRYGERLDADACRCVPGRTNVCTQTCAPGERLDAAACRCLPAPLPTCSRTCGPCEVLDVNACSCAPKSGSELPACQERFCGADYPGYCQAIFDRATGEPDELRRLGLYERACQGGHGRACYQLAELRSSSDPNERAARIDYYEKACNAGYSPGCTKVADLLGGSAAVEYYGRACNQANPGASDPTACRRYAEGLRTSNPARARSLYEATCQAGDVLSCSQLGRMMERGEGGPRDPLRARAAYRVACYPTRGDGRFDASACHDLGRVLVSTDAKESRASFERGCDANPPWLGCCETVGDLDLAGNAAAAAKRRFEKACSDGSGQPSACQKLGAMLDVRTAGNRGGLTEAKRRYGQACGRGLQSACTKSAEVGRLLEDADRDGLVALDDRCPKEAEDTDGNQDGDGCPDPDDDGDGILDGKDACRTTAETKNGVEDDDGCPEAKLSLTVACDGDTLDEEDVDVTVDGKDAKREGGGYVLGKGAHLLEVSGGSCRNDTLSVTVSPGESVARSLDLEKGALATAFTSVARSARLPSPGWSLDLAYSHHFLPTDVTFSRTPPEGSTTSSVTLPGNHGLNGLAVTASLLFKHAVLGLEAGVATASGLPVGKTFGRGNDADAASFPGGTATVTALRFPGLRAGLRVPFGIFALSAGGSFGVEHWRVDGESGSMPGLTLMTAEPWGELQAKLGCEVGLSVRGGRRFGLSSGDSDPFDYHYVNGGLAIQACRGSTDSKTVASSRSMLSVGYQQLFFPRSAMLMHGEGTYGLTFAGAPSLRGVTLEYAPLNGEYFSVSLGTALARGSELPVARYVRNPDFASDAESAVQEDVATDLTVLTLPSTRVDVRLPLGRLSFDLGLSGDLTMWKPSLGADDDDDHTIFSFGTLLGTTYHPVCSVGLFLHGGYKWGKGFGSSDGFDYGYLDTGLSYRTCE